MSEIDKYRKIYSDPNTRYGGSNHGRPYLPRILELNPTHLIDVGCGQNNLVAMLREHDINAIGLDPAAPQADIKYPANNIPFPDNSFDLLTAFDVLEHLPPSEVVETLTEFRRVLTPTGKALFTICTVASRSRFGDWRPELHPTLWKEDKWRAVIERHMGQVKVCEPAKRMSGGVIPQTLYVEVHL